jgi:hypothetical protein
MNDPLTDQKSNRRRKLIQLALLSFGIDIFTTLIELPFLVFILELAPVKELIEQLISTLIAGTTIKLTFTDRLIGLLPIPGVTAVTVRVFRELVLGQCKNSENKP